MFDCNLAVKPPLTDDQLRQVPAKRGVLLLAGEDGQPITMITAGGLRGRLQTRLAEPHVNGLRRAADLRQITRSVWWKLTPSHFETDLCFLELAVLIWPKRFGAMLSVKPPWFVSVDCDEPYPHFARTRDVLSATGTCVGPFPTGKAAEQFVQIVQDAFDLCRDVKCLRTSPNGPPCAYAQMGRCLSPCDGTISMDDYRLVVRRAASLAAGDRATRRAELTDRMRQAADAKQYERAASFKTRLERITQLDQPVFRFVAPLGRFAFLLIHRGPSSRAARVFCACGPRVESAGTLDYPLIDEQVAGVLARMSALAETARSQADPAGPWRMGLVAHYLFSGGDRRGVILPWHKTITPQQVAHAIDAGANALKLRAPRRRTKAASTDSGQRQPPDQRSTS